MNTRPFALVACFVVLLFADSTASAFKPGPPQRHAVYSPNKAFVVDVDPDRKVNTVYAANDARPLWSFPGRIWLEKVCLSNDGTVAAIVAWTHVKEESLPEIEGVVFWDKDGAFKSYSVHELCPDPKRTEDLGSGPVGEFWRTWYTDSWADGERVWLRTTGGLDYEFRLADGEITGRWRNESRLDRIRSALSRGSAGAWTAVILAVVIVAVAGYVLARRCAHKRPAEAPPAERAAT